MITLFRKIRQKLLQQNRVTRYLVYALGEIILVVIGILLALQINEWNKERIDRKTSYLLHQRIIEDLNQINERTEMSYSAAVENIELINFVVNCLNNKSIPEGKHEEFDQAILRFYRYSYPSFGLPTLEEMRSNGKLDLIYNVELRKKLNALEGLIANSKTILGNSGQSIQDNLLYFDTYIQSKVDPTNLRLSFTYDFDGMASDSEYINKFSRIVVNWRAVAFFNQSIQSNVTEIVGLVEDEIKKLK